MSSNYGERFSNENYLTNVQVSRTLGTTLIDDIWKEVLSYRGNFSATLPFRSVEKRRFNIVLTPKINDRINQLERRMNRVQIRLHELSEVPSRFLSFKTLQYREILRSVAHNYDISFGDRIVSQLISGDISVLSPQEMFLYDYFRGLELVSQADRPSFNETLLAEFSRLFNTPPLNNYIYRTGELKGVRSLINTVMPHFPVNQVRDGITDFFAFISESSLPTVAQSAALIFFLDYIKPFDAHSEIISILLCKTYLYMNEFTLLAPFINLEMLLDKYKERREEISNEVKKTNDLTYFLDLLINVMSDSLDSIEETITFALTSELENERLQLDEEVKVVKEEPATLFEHALAEQTANRPQSSIFVPKPGAIIPPKNEVNQPVVTPEEAHLVFSELPKELSDNDILKLERHLRESDPSLSRAECYYFARHCTQGKYYTINDFKEVTGCAYETARTSMDHLANSGYYRKEKFKNKFIYTPAKKA